MLDAGVNEHQLVALGVPGEVLILAAAAVEAQQGTLLAEAGDGLVHDAAVNAYILMLGALAYAGKLHAVNLVFAP